MLYEAKRGAVACISPLSESSGCITVAFKIFWKTYMKAAEDESVHVYK